MEPDDEVPEVDCNLCGKKLLVRVADIREQHDRCPD